MADFLVVGAGFAGATCARQLAEAGRSVLIVDKRDRVAGNAYDEINAHGIRVSLYGAHIFHTNSAEVWAFLSRFTAWRPYEHRVLAQTSRGLVPVPINTATIAAFDGDVEAAKREMYEPYTKKQWGEHAEHLLPSVLARVKARDTGDDRYFTDTYQAMPVDGYTALVERMLDHPNIDVELSIVPEGLRCGWAETIWTGPIDAAFGYRFGHLPYRSARFEFLTYGFDRFQPVAVVNHPKAETPFTRICEFTHLTGQQAEQTTIALEYPMADGEPYWPVPTAASADLYHQYEALARETPYLHFCGRLGTYRYLDIDQAVAQALKLSARLIARETRTSAQSFASQET